MTPHGLQNKMFLFLIIIFISAVIHAQAPNKISYQAVVRNSAGELIKNGNVSLRISILQGLNNIVYKETHTAQTNVNGLVSIAVGGGAVISGTFAGINWTVGNYFIQTEIDPNGGSSYTISTTSQLLSVPFALYANKAGNGFSGNYNDLTNKPTSKTDALPRHAARGQLLTVSFSGGDNISFTQASTSCSNLSPDVMLRYVQSSPTQASPTIIYSKDNYFINSKRFDAIFDIPDFVPSGLYDIIFGPSTSCPYTLQSSFKIF